MSGIGLAAIYRVHAARCVEIAKRAEDPRAKLVLLDMAKAWLALAHQADKNRETSLVYETPEPRAPVVPPRRESDRASEDQEW